jgi:hypothetical protein
VEVEGEATVSLDNGVQRFSGSLHNSNQDAFEPFEVTFTMERVGSGTPRMLGGRYRFAFDRSPSGCECLSRTIVDLEVPPTGLGRVIRATHDVDENSTLLGVVEPGTCLISPSGRVQCVLEYLRVFEPPAGQFPLPPPHFLTTLTGQLALPPKAVLPPKSGGCP